MALNRYDYYPLADMPSRVEFDELGVPDNVNLRYGIRSANRKCRLVAKWTCEYREPRRGEWYLSGAIIEAYQAPNDFTRKYHIAKLVIVKEKTILIEFDNWEDANEIK